MSDLHARRGWERHLWILVPTSALISREYECRFGAGAHQSAMVSCKRIIGSGAILPLSFSPHDAAFLEETPETLQQTGTSREPCSSNNRHRFGVWQGRRRQASFEKDLRADKIDEADSTTAPGTNRGGSSRIANRSQDRRTGDQQLPAQNASTPTPGQSGGDTCECSWPQLSGQTFTPASKALQGRGHTHRDSAEARSEQLGCNTPDLRSAEGDSKIRNQNDHEDRDPGVHQPSESAPERASEGGQDGRDTDDRRPRGMSSCSNCIAICTDHH